MASKYHTQVLNLLKKTYPGCVFKEEQNLYELVKNYNIPDNLQLIAKQCKTSLSQLRIDIWIDGMCAVEVHGEQHYQPVKFSNSIEDAEQELARRTTLDYLKQAVLKACGIATIVIKYDEIADLTHDDIKDKIDNALEIASKVPAQNKMVQKPGTNRTRQDAFHKAKLEKARKLRKKRYQQQKEWRKRHGK